MPDQSLSGHLASPLSVCKGNGLNADVSRHPACLPPGNDWTPVFV
jgi:hypothetical protein